MKHFLVTGANGFLGKHLASALLNRNDLRLSLIVGSSPQSSLPELPISDRMNFIYSDLESLTVERLLLLGPFDGVIHAAWKDVRNQNSSLHLSYNLPTSISFLKNFVRCCSSYIAVTGTCLEDPESGEEIRTPYRQAKVELYEELKKVDGIRLLWGRFSYIYGPGQAVGTLYDTVQQAQVTNMPIVTLASPWRLHDFIPVEVAAEQFVERVLEEELGVHDISSGKKQSVLSVAQSIARGVGYTGRIV